MAPALTPEQIRQIDYWFWRLTPYDEETCGLPDDPLERWLAIAHAVAGAERRLPPFLSR